MNVLLIGLRASGKTEAGRRLAALGGRNFVDLDDVVLAGFSEPSVREVWAAHGESAWREAEARVLETVLARDHQVIALGGGTPMVEAARRRVEAGQRHGDLKVVYLQCTADELARRLEGDTGDRPSLTGADPAEEVATVLAERDPTFVNLSDEVLDVTGRSPDEVAESLRDLLTPPDASTIPGTA